MPPSTSSLRASWVGGGALAALLVLLGAACDGDPAHAPADAGSDAHDAAADTVDAPRVVSLDEAGRSEAITVATDPQAAAVAIRVRPIDGADRCVQVVQAHTAEGEEWVEDADARRDWGRVCARCSQRVSVAHGWGLFVLPNDGRTRVGTEGLTLRVAERDCATGLPVDVAPDARAPADAVEIETRVVPAHPPEAVGVVPVRLVLSEASGFDAGTALDDPLLADALERVDAVLAGAGLRLDVVEAVGLSAPPADPLIYGPGLRDDLDALLADASAGADVLPVVLAGCLRREDPVTGATSQPLGVVPRIPDGWPPDGGGWGVALAGRGCSGGPAGGFWTGPALATILAHEVGHALGLYHAVEASGGEDHLPDTGADNLMNADPAGHLADGFSAAQAQVMRAHPVVRWSPDAAPSTPEP